MRTEIPDDAKVSIIAALVSAIDKYNYYGWSDVDYFDDPLVNEAMRISGRSGPVSAPETKQQKLVRFIETCSAQNQALIEYVETTKKVGYDHDIYKALYNEYEESCIALTWFMILNKSGATFQEQANDSKK